MTPELALELLKAGGVPVLIAYVILTNRPKGGGGNDAAAKLDAIHDRLIRMETKLDERLGK